MNVKMLADVSLVLPEQVRLEEVIDVLLHPPEPKHLHRN